MNKALLRCLIFVAIFMRAGLWIAYTYHGLNKLPWFSSNFAASLKAAEAWITVIRVDLIHMSAYNLLLGIGFMEVFLAHLLMTAYKKFATKGLIFLMFGATYTNHVLGRPNVRATYYLSVLLVFATVSKIVENHIGRDGNQPAAEAY